MVLQAVRNYPAHPTAEDVYNVVIKALPNISLTTVYRNLNKLAQQRAIKRLLIPDQPDRFEKNPVKHYHVSCEVCGAFEDLDDAPYDYSMDCFDCKKSGFYINSHDIIFKGLCPECRKKLKK
jgi:Fur family peroxide stress response transcriptional regulator